MDREVVEQKLESLRRCLQRIEAKCPTDAATLVADIDLQGTSKNSSHPRRPVSSLLKILDSGLRRNDEILIFRGALQDIISLNLSRAVQISVDIGAHLIAGMEVPPPDTMGQTFDLLAQEGVLDSKLAGSLKKAVGFRNITVHNYENINWGIVHSIVKYHLADFSEFARVVAMGLKK